MPQGMNPGVFLCKHWREMSQKVQEFDPDPSWLAKAMQRVDAKLLHTELVESKDIFYKYG